jgi:hypothetical protein
MEEGKKRTFIDRFLDIDRRIIYIITILCLGVPLIQPWGLPIAVDSMTQDFYDAIDELEPGDKILLSIDIESGMWGTMAPMAYAAAYQLWNKPGVQFVQVCFYRADGAVNFETLVLPTVEDETKKQYGVDWVNLGYLEGHEAAMAALAADFHYPEKDAYGTPLSQLPLMDEIKTMDDFKLTIDIGGGDWRPMIRQISVPYGKITSLGCSALDVSDALTYAQAGMMKGILNDLSGAAQYEFILGRPGDAIVTQDALSAAHIFLLAMVILVNIVYLTMGGRERRI